jgi:hypothetical protein
MESICPPIKLSGDFRFWAELWKATYTNTIISVGSVLMAACLSEASISYSSTAMHTTYMREGENGVAALQGLRESSRSPAQVHHATSTCIRFKVLRTVKMHMVVFWVVMPCGFVGEYHRFGRTYYTVSIFNPEYGDSMFLRCVVFTCKFTRRHNPEGHMDILPPASCFHINWATLPPHYCHSPIQTWITPFLFTFENEK